MLLGASGVLHPPLLALGDLAGAGVSDAAFNDANGFGQFDTDSDGHLYICDFGNTSIKKYTYAAGGYTYTEKATATSVFGSAVRPCLLTIDKTVTPNQIHIACDNQFVDSTWIGVWAITSWPGLTTGNRLRSYGSNSVSDVTLKARQGRSLTIDSTYAVVTSDSAPLKMIVWNHLTGAFEKEAAQGAVFARFATDGAGKWWEGSTSGSAYPGLWHYDPFTAVGVTRLDGTLPAAQNYRKGRSVQPTLFHFGPAYYGGKLYWKLAYGGVMFFDAVTDAYLDEVLWAGALQTGNFNAGAAPSTMNTNTTPITAKHGFVSTPGSDYYVQWASNADNNAVQSHLLLWPVSAGTATWTKTDWSAGTNTLQGIGIDGVSLSSEKYKVRLRKNAGSWVTLVAGQILGTAFTTAIAGLGTFTSGDTLTVELSLSTWLRLDGHATLYATRDKLSPANTSLELIYEDSAGDVYVPYASGALKGRLGGTGAFKGRLGG